MLQNTRNRALAGLLLHHDGNVIDDALCGSLGCVFVTEIELCLDHCVCLCVLLLLVLPCCDAVSHRVVRVGDGDRTGSEP